LTTLLNEGQWIPLEAIIYADGRDVPPDLLRKEPEQNHLTPGVRAVGFALMGIAILTAVAAVVWVFLHRKHRIVVAAQPYFLYELCGGAIISASTIFAISFDESYGWSDQQLGRACMATPWLLSLGHIITYGALFSKLWRINKVLQVSRRKIEIRHVAWPSAILFIAAIAILSLWTGLDSMTWQRAETDSVTGESIAQCQSDHIAGFMIPLVVLMLLPSILTAVMAWKTKDIDGSYSESYWICIMNVVQLEIILIAVPMIIVLRDVSTDARYVGFILLIWTFPMSTLLLMFVPKFLAHYKATHGSGDVQYKSKRGEVQGIRVSGLMDNNVSQPQASEHSGHSEKVRSSLEDGGHSEEASEVEK
jgi:gamma-aminobutyric acid type B receptor